MGISGEQLRKIHHHLNINYRHLGRQNDNWIYVDIIVVYEICHPFPPINDLLASVTIAGPSTGLSMPLTTELRCSA